jgi:hypothetical protein
MPVLQMQTFGARLKVAVGGGRLAFGVGVSGLLPCV